MYRGLRCTFLGLLIGLASVSADARELAFQVESRLGGDNNIFRNPEDSREISDGSWEFVPTISLRESGRELSYNFSYKPIFEAFFETENIDGWDHSQRGRIDWNANEKDSFSVSQTFVRSRSVREDFDGFTPITNEIILEESDREQISRASADISYSRQWNARMQSRIGIDFEDTDFGDSGSLFQNLDSRAYGANISANYVPKERWTVGLAGFGRFRRTKGRTNLFLRENAYIANFAGTVAHKLSPTIDLSVQAGPTFIWSKRQFADLDLDISFFATVDLRKEWERGNVSLVYSRTESGSAGDGSAILDSVRLQAQYFLIRQLQVVGSVTYTKRDSVAASRVGSAGSGVSQRNDSQSIRFSGLTQYEFRPSVFVGARLDYQEVKTEIRTRSDVSNILSGSVFIQYAFEPWVF